MDKNKKIILVIMIIVLFLVGIAIGAGIVYLITREEDYVPDVYIAATVPITEEQYQVLSENILSGQLEEMSSIRRRNAWLLLDAMAEIEFVEGRPQGQSGLGLATAILDLAGIGEIEEIIVVDTWLQFPDDSVTGLTLQIINLEGNVYYLRYHRTWGLEVLRRGSIDGEELFSPSNHTLIEEFLNR